MFALAGVFTFVSPKVFALILNDLAMREPELGSLTTTLWGSSIHTSATGRSNVRRLLESCLERRTGTWSGIDAVGCSRSAQRLLI